MIFQGYAFRVSAIIMDNHSLPSSSSRESHKRFAHKHLILYIPISYYFSVANGTQNICLHSAQLGSIDKRALVNNVIIQFGVPGPEERPRKPRIFLRSLRTESKSDPIPSDPALLRSTAWKALQVEEEYGKRKERGVYCKY